MSKALFVGMVVLDVVWLVWPPSGRFPVLMLLVAHISWFVMTRANDALRRQLSHERVLWRNGFGGWDGR